MQPRKRAFTLIELSIVLVIIGLLVGGVLVGRDLIRASEARRVISEYQSYIAAVNTFKGKYDYLPGDFPKATDFWGAQDANAATCITTSSTTALTCNGNGDGNLSTYVTPYTDFYELFRAWQHLANAGLVQGKYTGISASGIQSSIIDVNVPSSQISMAGWSFYPLQNAHSLAPGNFWNNNYNTVLTFGTIYPNATTFMSAISGPQAFAIDSKIDDGKPGYGIVSTYLDVYGTTCLTSSNQSLAAYIITDAKIRCGLVFKVN